MLEFGRENVHFTAILENDVAVEVDECNFGRVSIGKFDESFPHFGLLKDENFDDLAMLAEQLVEVVVRDYIAKFVINTDQQDGPVYLSIHQECLNTLIY